MSSWTNGATSKVPELWQKAASASTTIFWSEFLEMLRIDRKEEIERKSQRMI